MKPPQSLSNPIGYSTITDFLADVLEVIIIFAIPIVIFFLIYAGFQYVTARGNPEQIKTASHALLFGVIGGVIILASTALLVIVKNLVESF